ncbi:MAG: phosphate-binding protein, partial [Anaerolineae bacterium]|nr:phosphate-binding protein [Anaerolineae bacterium]
MRRPVMMIFALLVVMSLVLSACAPAATPAAEPTQAAVDPTATEAMAEPTATEAMPEAAPTLDPSDPASYSGDIYTAGSSTVGPLSEAVIEQFIADGFT